MSYVRRGDEKVEHIRRGGKYKNRVSQIWMAIEIPPIQVHGSRFRVLRFTPCFEKDRKLTNLN